MISVSKKLLVTCLMLFALIHNAVAQNLICKVTLTEKHFRQIKEQVFDGLLDINERMFVLSQARKIYRYREVEKLPLSNLHIARLKIYELVFEITNFNGELLHLQKLGSVSNGKIPAIPYAEDKFRFFEVRKDDAAIGTLNQKTGEVLIQTRFFMERGMKYEYGWKMSGLCNQDLAAGTE